MEINFIIFSELDTYNSQEGLSPSGLNLQTQGPTCNNNKNIRRLLSRRLLSRIVRLNIRHLLRCTRRSIVRARHNILQAVHSTHHRSRRSLPNTMLLLHSMTQVRLRVPQCPTLVNRQIVKNVY
jgi:hypothetical protein